MPITFPIVDHPARSFKPYGYKREVPSNDPNATLASLPTAHIPKRLLQSSVDGSQTVVVKKNGFVLGALKAYSEHHHLVIRPDDVWIAILSQLNYYINVHAEELRDKFVSHEDKKDLVVSTQATIHQADFGDLAIQMAEQIHNNVKDESLIPWVLPDFSTTTPNDTVICSVLIMSTLKQYFRYIMMCGCGIPSLTIEGMQSDWKSILERIDKIPEFGDEPAEWAKMLRVIITRFVRAFDKGGPQADKEFWERIIHEEAGSGSYFISGWMGAFCAWDNKGAFLPSRNHQNRTRAYSTTPQWVHGLKFDDVWFPRVWSPPEGYAEVDVVVHDLQTDTMVDCAMLAGHVGFAIEGEKQPDTVRIAPQWFMYVKGEKRTVENGFWIPGG